MPTFPRHLLLPALGWLLACQGACAQALLQAKDVSVHLFLTPSGSLSEDVSALPSFSSWNRRALQPLQPLDEDFSAFLVKVKVPAGAATGLKSGSLSLRAPQRGNKVVYSAPLDVRNAGSDALALAKWVEGQVCEPLELVVELGKARVSKPLDFHCGE